jgi:hypothetical protein
MSDQYRIWTSVQPTGWCVECAVDPDHWGYLALGGQVSCGDGSDRRWFASPEEAQVHADQLASSGWEAVSVQSNARY